MCLKGFQKIAIAVAAPALMLAACGSEPSGPPQFAELLPVEMMQAAVPPPPAPPPAPVETKPAPAAPAGPVYGGHLASYFHAADARRGWNVIVRQESSIGSLKPHIVPIKTAKGPMVRLIAGDFPSREEATRFCTWAHTRRLYCAVMVLGPHDETAAPLPKPAKKAPASRRARR